MFRADLVITAGGISLYEALAARTPACALSYDRYQRATVRAVAEAGACIDLGAGDRLKRHTVAGEVASLDANRSRRRRLSVSGGRLVDGRGAMRVARILRALIENPCDGHRSPAAGPKPACVSSGHGLRDEGRSPMPEFK
jgi:UDP-N-acetylglucosamine:LPS N-acetylglucosamine transferase